MAAKKYYAVAVGRRPGIYTNWPEAKTQVDGYPGARFKGFASRAEAEGWLRETPPRQKTPGGKKRVPLSQSQDIDDKTTLIYTDGGALNNPGPGGYGIVIITDQGRQELSGGFRLTTNNRMELTACLVALKTIRGTDRPILLFSDSSYVVNGITKGWAKSWRKNGWLKADKQKAVNSDLWSELLSLTEGLNISFRWVKGHAGHPENECCDRLAVAAARQKDLPEDPGYLQQAAGRMKPDA